MTHPTWQPRNHAGPSTENEGGAVAVEFALGVGLLLLPVAILVLVLPTWVEHQSMARVAAAEAARTLVLADDETVGISAATTAVHDVAANHGLTDAVGAVTFDGHLTRGGTVTAHVTVRIPVIRMPLVGRAGGFSFTVSHRESVDQYRSFDAGGG